MPTLKQLPLKSSPTSIPTVKIKKEDRKGLIHLNKDVPLPDTYSEGTFPIDIIAIHGINGGPYSTWTHSNGSFWLGDFLTEEFPGARIFSFAYAAKVFLSFDTSDFEAFARGLLEGILAERKTAEVGSSQTLWHRIFWSFLTSSYSFSDARSYLSATAWVASF